MIPSGIEQYVEHDDHHLMKFLRKSSNINAISIIRNDIPPKIYESFNEKQHKKLKNIEKWLIEKKIDYIKGSSESKLSKYYIGESKALSLPLKVVRNLQGGKTPLYLEITEATDLFEKFKKANSIMRLHCRIKKLKIKDQLELQNLILEE
jgi:hypothetical protein